MGIVKQVKLVCDLKAWHRRFKSNTTVLMVLIILLAGINTYFWSGSALPFAVRASIIACSICGGLMAVHAFITIVIREKMVFVARTKVLAFNMLIQLTVFIFWDGVIGTIMRIIRTLLS